MCIRDRHRGERAMELTDRKKRVLRAIVETYINTAGPVGSKAIAQLAGLDVSAATIRNEMADLTEMGLLEHCLLYTSGTAHPPARSGPGSPPRSPDGCPQIWGSLPTWSSKPPPPGAVYTPGPCH